MMTKTTASSKTKAKNGTSKRPHKKPKRCQTGKEELRDKGGRPVILAPGVQAVICAEILAGATAEIAAESAGVSRRSFTRWLELGRSGVPFYEPFWRAVRTARAIVRAKTEGMARLKDPLAWLRVMAPTTDDVPGWTEPSRSVLPSGVPGPILADESELDNDFWRDVFRVGFEIAAAGHFAGRMAAAFLPPPPTEAVQAEESNS